MSVISIDVMNAMRYIGVSPEDYELSSASFIRRQISRIHGIGHIYRVMIFVALLAERKQKSREGLLAFCAAYLHDLARLNDGWDPEHGFRAVSLMSQYNALWEKYNLSSVELEYIKYAMANHNKGCSHFRLKLKRLSTLPQNSTYRPTGAQPLTAMQPRCPEQALEIP